MAKLNYFLNKFLILSLFVGLAVMLNPVKAVAYAQTEDVIQQGVYVEGMDLAGMTRNQAKVAIENYVYSIIEDKDLIFIQYDDVAEHSTAPSTLGAYWNNEELLDEIIALGNRGHVVKRYKERKDLERTPVDYAVEISFHEENIISYLEKTFTKYDKEVRNLGLEKQGDSFVIVEGQKGYKVDIEKSAHDIVTYLSDEWDRTPTKLNLQIAVVEPKGTEEELKKVKDVIGSYSSNFRGGTAEKVANISNGARLMDGILLYPGEEFSFDAYAAPYTISNGYAVGKAYESGKLVDSVGGGICQVSSTLYNAILRAELEVTMRYNHSMIVGYVPISSDATLAETSGKDLRFKNNLDAPIYIEAYTTKDHKLVTNIYGEETRPSNRTVEYISETLEVINPGPDVIHVDGTKPVGEIIVSSAYTGYKAQLWKVVKIDGVEKSREIVNKSNYRAVARTATVGMNTSDPAVLEQMNAAVATGNIDHVKNVIHGILHPAEQ